MPVRFARRAGRWRRCVVGVVGMGLELCLRRTYGRDPLYGLLLTFGAALVLEETIRAGLGPDRALPADARAPSPAASTIGGLIYSEVPVLRLGVRGRHDPAALAVPRAHAATAR